MIKYVKASDDYNEIYTSINLAGTDYELFIVGVPMGVGDNGEFEYAIIIELHNVFNSHMTEIDGAKLCSIIPALRNFHTLDNIYADEIKDVMSDIKNYFRGLEPYVVDNIANDFARN